MVDICDFHSHILPMADHGSISVEQTTKQLLLAKKCNVTRIFATSHFYPHRDSVDDFLARRDASYSKLKTISFDGIPEVKLGAEVLLCPGMQKLPGIDSLTIKGTNVLLLELPFNDFSRAHINTVSSLIMDGFNIVLAHAERYDEDWVSSLLDLGVKIQLNASAIIPIFRDDSVNRWLKNGYVVALGSDIHGVDKHAYRNFSNAIRRLGRYATNVKAFTDDVWSKSN